MRSHHAIWSSTPRRLCVFTLVKWPYPCRAAPCRSSSWVLTPRHCIAGIASWRSQSCFHHPNVRLPISLERFLSRLIVTPRMHGIHDSQVNEQWTNCSSGLALWDYILGTYRFDVPQESLRIRLERVTQPEQVALYLHRKNFALGADFSRIDGHLVRVESIFSKCDVSSRISDFRRTAISDFVPSDHFPDSMCNRRGRRLA